MTKLLFSIISCLFLFLIFSSNLIAEEKLLIIRVDSDYPPLVRSKALPSTPSAKSAVPPGQVTDSVFDD